MLWSHKQRTQKRIEEYSDSVDAICDNQIGQIQSMWQRGMRKSLSLFPKKVPFGLF